MIKLGAKELRSTTADPKIAKKLKKNPIYIICDNILDTYNVGSIFRLADAAAAEKVYLCGVTETPPNTRIKKASINTTEWVTWEYTSTTVEAISNIKYQISNTQVIAIEQDKRAVRFDKAEYSLPVAFVVGNETSGISKEILGMCDQIVEIPMWGVNKSLNVMVSLGIVVFNAASKLLSY